MNAPIDVTNIRIETPRLILRSWHEQDLNDFFTYASVPGVGEMAGWCHHSSMEESAGILDFFIREKKTFALELKENGAIIGSLGLEPGREIPSVTEHLQGREIGYVLSKDYWGRGLMPEAVAAVIQYCFSVLQYDYLLCSHFLRNSQSRRVIEKNGFHYQEEILYETQMGTVETAAQYILYNPNK